MKEVTELRLTSKRVMHETIERYRVDIPDGSTEEEREHLFRELAFWYNHFNPGAGTEGTPTASQAIIEETDEHGRFYWFSNGYSGRGNDMNTLIYKNLIDTEEATRF